MTEETLRLAVDAHDAIQAVGELAQLVPMGGLSLRATDVLVLKIGRRKPLEQVDALIAYVRSCLPESHRNIAVLPIDEDIGLDVIHLD